MEVKDNSKRAASQIKMIAISKAVPVNSYNNAYVGVLRKNKARTSVLLAHMQQGKKTPKMFGSQRY